MADERTFLGKRVAELTGAEAVDVILVIRGELRLLPTDSLTLQKGDVVILRSDRIVKKKAK